jgi:hypothetical protein
MLPQTSAYVSIRQHGFVAHRVDERQHMSAYDSIRQHTSAYDSIPGEDAVDVGFVAHRVDEREHENRPIHCGKRAQVRSERQMVRFACQQTSAYVSIRQHTSAYVIHCGKRGKVRIERQMVRLACQKTSGYVRIRLDTSGDVKWAVSARWRALPGSTCGFGVSVTSAPSSCRLPVSIRRHTSAYVSIRQHTCLEARAALA